MIRLSGVAKCLTAAAAFSFLNGATECVANDAINSFLASEPIKKTPEYLEQGKRNVKNVAEQLKALLEPVPASAKRIVTPLPKPDFTIIKGSNGRSTLIYRCRYIQANRASVIAIENMLRNGSVEFHAEQNLLTIYDSSENIENLKNALLAIDKPMPQVVVEVKVIEVLFSDGMNRNLSFQFNDSDRGKNALHENTLLKSTGGIVNNNLSGSSEAAGLNLNWFPYVSGTKSMQTSFQWVLNGQDAKVLTSPNLVISRNEEASLSTGQDIPIQEMSTTSSGTNIATTFRRVGVTLTLTPMIINDNLVTLRVAPEVSTVQQYQRINQGYDASTGEAISFQVPVISIRNLDTTLTLRDGEVIMMGGLYSNRTSMQEDRTPLLSDLPYIGELFTSKNREQEIVQLVFFMRVHILRPAENPSGIAFDPDEVANTSSRIGEILQNSSSLPKLKSTLQQLKEEFIDEPERRRKANDPEKGRDDKKSAVKKDQVPTVEKTAKKAEK
ncbi:MAG: type II and III secretion system protein [Lentisphaeria bacterium]|nr:type II and III secretion system protein [Lentisphaeria bacterium]